MHVKGESVVLALGANPADLMIKALFVGRGRKGGPEAVVVVEAGLENEEEDGDEEEEEEEAKAGDAAAVVADAAVDENAVPAAEAEAIAATAKMPVWAQAAVLSQRMLRDHVRRPWLLACHVLANIYLGGECVKKGWEVFGTEECVHANTSVLPTHTYLDSSPIIHPQPKPSSLVLTPPNHPHPTQIQCSWAACTWARNAHASSRVHTHALTHVHTHTVSLTYITPPSTPNLKPSAPGLHVPGRGPERERDRGHPGPDGVRLVWLSPPP